METIEVLNMLRHNRHDLMNQIQLLQGYMSMNRPEKVKQKLQELVQDADQQRKLMDLQANEFALWLIQVNMYNKQIRVVYKVDDVSENLQYMDLDLLKQTKKVFAAVEAAASEDELYHILLSICNPVDKHADVVLQFRLSGKQINEDIMNRLLQHEDIQMESETNGMFMLTAVF